MIATNSLTIFHSLYGRLNDAGKNPKWFSKTFGKCEVFIIKFDK